MKLCIAVVTRQTRLEGLRARWGTRQQAKFLLAQAHAHEDMLREEIDAKATVKRKKLARQAAQEDAEFDLYEHEDAAYHDTLGYLQRELDFGLPIKVIDRSFVPNFDFFTAAVVVVVGQDGLVANAAKYVGGRPIVAVNPDPANFDGILLPFQAPQARRAVKRVLDNKYRARKVTLAECQLNDGQKMLAFNDFFLGCATHTSARYTLEFQGQSEPQSSSGVLVSTGAGSTGWLSSVFNMAAGINRLLGGAEEGGVKLPWEDRRLVWAVREPFASRHSQANLVAGILNDGDELVLESLMPESGVIFSDGIEADFLTFNTGTIARIAASKQTANLVVD
jgi:NAD kinase